MNFIKKTSLNPRNYQSQEVSIAQEVYLGSKRKSKITLQKLKLEQKKLELEILKRDLVKQSLSLLIKIISLEKSQ